MSNSDYLRDAEISRPPSPSLSNRAESSLVRARKVG
jgi:hypothetical protein